MGLIRDDKVEVGRREEALVFVVEEQRLNGRDDDLGASPVITALLVDDCFVVVLEDLVELLYRLSLQFKAVDEEQHPAGVPCAEEELDEGGGN